MTTEVDLHPDSLHNGIVKPTLVINNADFSAPHSSPECRPKSRRFYSNGYRWLNETNRHFQYTTRFPVCDDLLFSGWYRFGGGAGTMIPTKCVPTYRCGTSAPGWMKGSLPTTADGEVTRTVAFHWDGNCQKWSQNIKVINCGRFYVYHLSSPTLGCSLRYCGS